MDFAQKGKSILTEHSHNVQEKDEHGENGDVETSFLDGLRSYIMHVTIVYYRLLIPKTRSSGIGNRRTEAIQTFIESTTDKKKNVDDNTP